MDGDEWQAESEVLPPAFYTRSGVAAVPSQRTVTLRYTERRNAGQDGEWRLVTMHTPTSEAFFVRFSDTLRVVIGY
jgi:hypothetical protein